MIETGQKYRTVYIKTQVGCIVFGDMNSPYNHFCATLNTVALLTVTFTSTIHTGHFVAFPLRHLLRKRATMLRYAYIAYLVVT